MSQSEPLILLAEDNLSHAKLVRRSLAERRLVHRVIHVTDGASAVAYLEDCGQLDPAADKPLPHVILLDLRLPKVDGLEVLERLKGNPALARIPVVILSTSSAPHDVARAYALHANSYVVKPLNFKVFSQLIGDLGTYWLFWNQPANS